MSRFYVGQRVRLARLFIPAGATTEAKVGMEGFVNKIGSLNYRGQSIDYGVTIEGDSGWCFNGDELEPILPPGLESLEDTLALWEPEGDEVRA